MAPKLGPPKTVTCTTSGSAVEPVEVNKAGRGQPNRVSTTHFTLVTWLPKSLFAQFQRAANIYFAFVSILVFLPGMPYDPSSTVVPFGLVLLWTALKDLYEDVRRRQDDDAENLRTCWRYDYKSKTFEEVRWCDVLCGDILCTLCDEAFPADLLLLYTLSGQAFISTVNLDGETNLKERRAVDVCTVVLEELAGQLPARSARIMSGKSLKAKGGMQNDVKAIVESMAGLLIEQGFKANLDEPRAALTEMGGQVRLSAATTPTTTLLAQRQVSMPFQIGYDHFVPRGCVLRNTGWTLCLAAYVGNETKTRLNVSAGQQKVSNMQYYLNRCIVGLVIVLICFCIYAAIRSRSEDDHRTILERFLIYWVILYQIVPISLYVAFEVFKLLLGYMINADKLMVDSRTELGAKARTADLVEELGQVDFIFSDKTGTLTENEMCFAHCCIDGRDLGDFREAEDKASLSSPPTPCVPPGLAEVRRILQDPTDPLRSEVRWFFFCLAVCHSAQVELEDGRPIYSGSSPDEVAFLDAAHRVGVTYIAKKRAPNNTNWELHISGPAGEGTHVFTLLTEIPFSSDRKRMSVLVEYMSPMKNGDHKSRGEIFCITKGADNVIGSLVEEPFPASTSAQLDRFSMLGLRTLAVSSKVVDRSHFTKWMPRYQSAQYANEDRDNKVNAITSEMESQLVLAGISAIEDRLQQGVPETITAVKAAGIRFWVLTGDKMETAVEIVRACKLFTDDMVVAYMANTTSEKHMWEQFETVEKQLQNTKNGGLVIDGTFAKHTLAVKQARERLYNLAMASKACVCCRLSPQQKRTLVELVREFNGRAITLAIGDGANDVSMIQGAQVGIGVRGKEGNQAVQASDIAISQFRFLGNLLFCHGRRAYRRVALFLCYYIYKHVVLVMADMIWAHQSDPRFGGDIAYPIWLSTSFSLLFSTLQVLVIVGFDRDVPDKVALAHPELYVEGVRRIRFNAPIFTVWMLSAMWHGAIAWLVPYFVIDPAEHDGEDFWVTSTAAFSLVIIFINLRIWLFSLNRFAWYTLLVIFISILAYVIVLLFFGYTTPGKTMQEELWHIPEELLDTSDERPALYILLLTPLVFILDWIIFTGYHLLRPDPLDIVRRQNRGSSCAKVVAAY